VIKIAGEGVWPKTPGDIWFSSDANDLRLRMKTFTQSNVDTHTGDTNWTDVTNGSFTLSANGGAVLGIVFKAELKTSQAGQNANATIKISGTNLGDRYMTLRELQSYDTGSRSDNTRSVVINTSEDAVLITDATSNQDMAANAWFPVPLSDDTTTFQIRFKIDDANETVTIDEMEVIVVYTKVIAED